MIDLLMLLKSPGEYLFLLIPAAFTIIIQVLKYLFRNKLKSPDFWLKVVLIAGTPMAFLELAINGVQNFGVPQFILATLIYSAISSIMYKVGKVGGKSFYDILQKKKYGK